MSISTKFCASQLPGGTEQNTLTQSHNQAGTDTEECQTQAIWHFVFLSMCDEGMRSIGRIKCLYLRYCAQKEKLKI